MVRVVGDIDPQEYYLKHEIEEFEKLFHMFDKDGGGSVDVKEMKGVFQAVGISLKPYQMDKIIGEFDVDGSGEIEFEEFMVMMIKLLSKKVRADCINYNEYLSDEQKDMYEKHFRLADTTGDGSVGREELATMFSRLGFKMTEHQLDEIILEVDKDLSGEIEFDEFCAMMVKLTGVRKRINPREYMEREDLDSYKRAFVLADADNSGAISIKELDALLRRMGVVLKRDQVDGLLAKYDVDANGVVDFQEFAAMMVDLKKLRRKTRITPETCSATELRDMGFSADEVKLAGFSAALMREGKYSANEMIAAQFRPLQLRHAGYSAIELRRGGIEPSELKRCGYSATELRNAGYSAGVVRGVSRHLNVNSTDVPHFMEHRAKRLNPLTPGNFTPRVRYFADDEMKKSKGNMKGVLVRQTNRMVKAQRVVNAFGGGAAGLFARKSSKNSDAGMAGKVSSVMALGGEGHVARPGTQEKPVRGFELDAMGTGPGSRPATVASRAPTRLPPLNTAKPGSAA
jgi:Ca2+-binding EF-hand superfamily protein